jgi:hypothetical protein
MNKDDILKAFAELCSEDQEAVRKEITGSGASQEGEAPCCPPTFHNHMKRMAGEMKAVGGPMAICKEMMAKCGA